VTLLQVVAHVEALIAFVIDQPTIFDGIVQMHLECVVNKFNNMVVNNLGCQQ
jgi:hypothetical protein